MRINPRKALDLVLHNPGKTAKELAEAFGCDQCRLGVHLQRLVWLKRIHQVADTVNHTLHYYPSMLDDKIIGIVAAHPGKTISELARISKMESGSLATILCDLAKAGRLVRRREADMRTAKRLEDPTRFVLSRLLGTDAGKAWRFYPVVSNAKQEPLL